MTNGCLKGKVGEREVIALLRQYWPDACRNLDQCRGDSGTDVLNTKGVHFQVKRTERLKIWDALAQAHADAQQFEIPCVVFRRNRSEWHACLPLDELLPLLALRDL